MARINNGRNLRRKNALERLETLLQNGGYIVQHMGETIKVRHTPERKAQLQQEIETLKTRIHN